MARRGMRLWRGVALCLVLAGLTGCGQGEEARDPLAGRGQDTGTGRPRPGKSGGETRWVHTVRGAAEGDGPVEVVHDQHGHLVTLGNERTEDGRPVMTLTRYTPGGQRQWERRFELPPRAGRTPTLRAQTLAVGPGDGLVLTGWQSGGLELGGEPLTPGAFLARLDAEGRPLWARPLPVYVTELEVDKQGGVTVAGVLTGTVDFGTGPVSGLVSPFLARYSAWGEPLWVFVDSGRGLVRDLGRDDAGELYLVGGRFLEGSPLLHPFLARVDRQGRLRWMKVLEGAGGQLTSVEAHGDHVVVSGDFTGRLRFGDEWLEAPRSRGLVLAYDRDGAERWGALVGSAGALVRMDQGSGVVLAGRYTGGEEFGLGVGRMENDYPGPTNLYVLRLKRSTGKLEWLRTYPSASVLPGDLSVTRQGAVALVGTFRAPVDLGTGPLLPEPGTNTFLLHLER